MMLDDGNFNSRDNDSTTSSLFEIAGCLKCKMM